MGPLVRRLHGNDDVQSGASSAVMTSQMCSFQVKNVEEADCAFVSPTPNNGWPEIVDVYHARVRAQPFLRDRMIVLQNNDETRRTWLIFQRVVYEYDSDKKVFCGLDYPVNEPLERYKNAKGYETNMEVEAAQRKFGTNKCVWSI